MSEPVTYQLKHPVTFKLKGPDGERDETLTELTLLRLKGKDMRGAPENEADLGLHLIQRSAGLTAMQVDELDLEDITELGELITGFTPPGAPIGKTP